MPKYYASCGFVNDSYFQICLEVTYFFTCVVNIVPVKYGTTLEISELNYYARWRLKAYNLKKNGMKNKNEAPFEIFCRLKILLSCSNFVKNYKVQLNLLSFHWGSEVEVNQFEIGWAGRPVCEGMDFKALRWQTMMRGRWCCTDVHRHFDPLHFSWLSFPPWKEIYPSIKIVQYPWEFTFTTSRTQKGAARASSTMAAQTTALPLSPDLFSSVENVFSF